MSLYELGMGLSSPKRRSYISAFINLLFAYFITLVNHLIIPVGIAKNFPKNINTRDIVLQQDLEILSNTVSFRERLCLAVSTIPHAFKIRGYIKCR